MRAEQRYRLRRKGPAERSRPGGLVWGFRAATDVGRRWMDIGRPFTVDVISQEMSPGSVTVRGGDRLPAIAGAARHRSLAIAPFVPLAAVSNSASPYSATSSARCASHSLIQAAAVFRKPSVWSTTSTSMKPPRRMISPGVCRDATAQGPDRLRASTFHRGQFGPRVDDLERHRAPWAEESAECSRHGELGTQSTQHVGVNDRIDVCGPEREIAGAGIDAPRRSVEMLGPDTGRRDGKSFERDVGEHDRASRDGRQVQAGPAAAGAIIEQRRPPGSAEADERGRRPASIVV